jgi:hypothetical protein
MTTINNTRINLDKAGIIVSALCAIHCLTLPVLVSVLPLIGLQFLADKIVEFILILVALFIATLSLSGSYLKIHRNFFPIAVIFIGFLILIIGRNLFEESEVILTVSGALLVITAHIFNWKLSNKIIAAKENPLS